MLVSTNLSSLSAQRMLFENNKAASSAMERLATGSKINKAQDDVAGSAIADRMTSQVRGLNMAVKNANDAMAMLSVADSAASDITDMLQRMRELAIQAASDTNSAADRQYLQDEVNSLIQEIDRVATQTQYNGENLLDGSKSASFQVGASSGQTVGFEFDSLAFVEQPQSSSQEYLSTVDTGNTVGQATSYPASKTYNDYETLIEDFIVDAGVIQNLRTGDTVEFESHPGISWTVSQDGARLQDIRVSFYVRGDASNVSGRIFKVTSEASESLSNDQPSPTIAVQRDSRIFAQGVEYSEYPKSIQLSADGNTIVIGTPFSQNEGGYVSVYKWEGETWQQVGSNITQEGWFERWGNNVAIDGAGNRIAVVAGEGRGSYVEVLEWSGSDWIQVGSRFGAGSYYGFGDNVSLSHDGNTLAVGNSSGHNSDGEVKVFDWNGAEWVQRGGAVVGENYQPNNANYRPQFGQDVSLSADGNAFTVSAEESTTNGGIGDGYVKTFTWDGSSWIETLTTLRGKDSIEFGRSVEMSANGESVLVFAPSADSWGQGAYEGVLVPGAGQAYVFDTKDGQWLQRGEGLSGGQWNSASYGGAYHSHDAAISQSGDRVAIFTLAARSPDNSHVSIFDWDGHSWIEIDHLEIQRSSKNDFGAFDLSANGLVLSVTSGDDILTFDLPTPFDPAFQNTDFENAGAFLTSVDQKIEAVTAQRAEYGAMQNRLQYTISNLMSVSENTVAARSRIEDADFATESAVLAKSQVLQQSGAAMLAQANARPQLVLQLIK